MGQQLLLPLEEFHPMTQNHYLTENVQKAQAKRQSSVIRKRVTEFLGEDQIAQGNYQGNFQVDKLIDCLLSSTGLMEPNMDKYAASLATDTVEAYYKVALKKFIDDFEVNAVEVYLMQKLPDIFSPLVVMGLTDEIVSDIAGESEEGKQERRKLEAKMAALTKGEELMILFLTEK
ncbi:uncharacterized protein PG986_002839 [Apiospora aurea]|uniref:GED domain-containing protein n=1 Tax=Apiospora aurea TaxID=335848 RepID=A0ABR1QPZ1_9PEZI